MKYIYNRLTGDLPVFQDRAKSIVYKILISLDLNGTWVFDIYALKSGVPKLFCNINEHNRLAAKAILLSVARANNWKRI